MRGPLVAGDVLGELQRKDIVQLLALEHVLGRCEPGDGLGQELPGRRGRTEIVRALAVETQLPASRVKFRAHAIALFWGSDDGRRLCQRHAADTSECVADDLALQPKLPLVRDMREDVAATPPVSP